LNRTEGIALRWTRLNLDDPNEAQEAFAISRRASCVRGGIGARALDLAWRSDGPVACESLYVYRLVRDDVVAGFAVLSRRDRPLKLMLGEVTIAKVPLKRYWHLGDPFLGDEVAADGVAADACDDLLASLVRSLGPRECVFFEGLPTSGPMCEALHKRSQDFVHLQLGPAYEHQFIDMPGSFADYVAQLGSRSRQSLLYSQRKLLRDMADDVRCECFHTVDSVDRFVADAVAVSRKTYQWTLLGLGLRDQQGLGAMLRRDAEHGWMRSFILYCRGAPVAFMLGSQHGDCYYYDDVGYDPDFARWSVGSVLQMYVLEALYEQSDPPKTFDFSTGYGEHKGRFGNRARSEANVLVFPATLQNRWLVSAYRVNESLGNYAKNLLERVGLKGTMKRFIRRYSMRKGGTG